MTSNAVVTVRKTADFDINEVVRRWDQSTDLAAFGPGFLLYGLLDYVVDTQFQALSMISPSCGCLDPL